MKRARFAAFAAIILQMPLVAVAATGRRCAILIANDRTVLPAESDRIAARVGSGLLRSSKYLLVDRSRLSSVLREQGFSNSAYADPRTAAALGRIVGAQQILHVTATMEVDQRDGPMVRGMTCMVSGTFEIVQVDTARIVATGTADGSDEKTVAAGSAITGVTATRRNAIDAFADDVVRQVLES